MTPKSKEGLREKLKNIARFKFGPFKNTVPAKILLMPADSDHKSNGVGVEYSYDAFIDDVLELLTSYRQHLYTKDDVRAICEEVVGTDTPNEWEDDEIHAWPYYDDYSSNAADYANGYNQAKAEQRQSIDSIIDRWGK